MANLSDRKGIQQQADHRCQSMDQQPLKPRNAAAKAGKGREQRCNADRDKKKPKREQAGVVDHGKGIDGSKAERCQRTPILTHRRTCEE